MSPRRSSAARSSRLAGSAPLFAALGDQTRLRMVARLAEEGRLSTGRLTSGTKVTRQAVTKHLHVLAGAGLVRDSRQGRERLWELEPQQLEEARRWLEVISRGWDDALARLKSSIER